MATVDDEQVRQLLTHADLVIEGQLVSASNGTLKCNLQTADGTRIGCVYKPVRGERDLWDFPPNTLGRREVATSLVDSLIGWNLVPPTVWRSDGPYGPGMCQLWIDADPDVMVVDIARPGHEPAAWRHVLRAQDDAGRPVTLVHADQRALQRLVIFDAITNNADRKGGHILTDLDGGIWAIDHGLTFSPEPKLRTVLWGWAGEDIPEDILHDLELLTPEELTAALEPWLTPEEVATCRMRMDEFLQTRKFPTPSGGWPAIPWPVF
jgi:uncharacterized repeat protein (TIGR03843 family)